jgi:tetratricopeptide (TPR) repeat protein
MKYALLGAVVVVASGYVSTPAPQAAQDPVDALFAAYVGGRYDAVWAELGRTEDWGDLRDAISGRRDVWPAEARAAFALEAAIVAQQTARRARNAYQDEVGLFKDACRMVRDLPPGGGFEAAWHEVALSLLAAPSAGIDAGDHLEHIRDRMDPGRWALAAVGRREEQAWFFLTEVQPGANLLDDARVRRGRVNLRLVIEHLERAEAFENVRAQARLRRGALLAGWGESSEALEALLPVSGLTTDPRLRHLALVHAGRVLLADGERVRARQVLDEALALVPDSRAALLLLASLEFTENHRAEADHLTRLALASDHGQDDPWFSFFEADWRALPGRIAAMREALR